MDQLLFCTLKIEQWVSRSLPLWSLHSGKEAEKKSCPFWKCLFIIYLAVLGLSCGTRDLRSLLWQMSFWVFFSFFFQLYLHRGMWNLVPWPGTKPGPTALGVWAIREALKSYLILKMVDALERKQKRRTVMLKCCNFKSIRKVLFDVLTLQTLKEGKTWSINIWGKALQAEGWVYVRTFSVNVPKVPGTAGVLHGWSRMNRGGRKK